MCVYVRVGRGGGGGGGRASIYVYFLTVEVSCSSYCMHRSALESVAMERN